MRPRYLRHLLNVLGLAVCLTDTGCDKLLNRESSDEGPHEAEQGSTDTTKQAEPVEAKVEDEPSAKSDDASDEQGTDDAEEEAQRLAEEEAKKIAEEEAGKPLILSDVAVEAGGMFGGGSLRIRAKGKINDTIAASTYVHAKSLCRRDERIIADTGYVNTGFQKQLEQHAPGEIAELQGNVFTQGIDRAPSPCQIEFRLGGAGGGVSIPLATVCFDGSSTKGGPCDPPVVAAPMSGTGAPLEVHDLSLKKDSNFGSNGLDARYVVQFNSSIDPSTRLTLKTACDVGETRFVDMGTASLVAGPFRFESGESVVRTAKLYWNAAFGFAEAPNLCDVSVSSWASKSGAFGEQVETVLASACYRDGETTPGPCDSARPIPPAASPMAADSIELDNASLQIDEPHGAKGDRFQLELQVDATVRKPVDQRSGIQGKVTCKVGRTARVESAYVYGIELFYLQPGETTRMTTTAFSANAMEQRPRSCEVVFLGGERFSLRGDEGIELGRWCLEKDKTKKGKC